MDLKSIGIIPLGLRDATTVPTLPSVAAGKLTHATGPLAAPKAPPRKSRPPDGHAAAGTVVWPPRMDPSRDARKTSSPETCAQSTVTKTLQIIWRTDSMSAHLPSCLLRSFPHHGRYVFADRGVTCTVSSRILSRLLCLWLSYQGHDLYLSATRLRTSLSTMAVIHRHPAHHASSRSLHPVHSRSARVLPSGLHYKVGKTSQGRLLGEAGFDEITIEIWLV